MKDTGVWRNVCLKQGTVYFGQELVMTSGRQWNDVESASQLPELSNQLEISVKFHHMHGTPLEQICSTGTRWTT